MRGEEPAYYDKVVCERTVLANNDITLSLFFLNK